MNANWKVVVGIGLMLIGIINVVAAGLPPAAIGVMLYISGIGAILLVEIRRRPIDGDLKYQGDGK